MSRLDHVLRTGLNAARLDARRRRADCAPCGVIMHRPPTVDICALCHEPLYGNVTSDDAEGGNWAKTKHENWGMRRDESGVPIPVVILSCQHSFHLPCIRELVVHGGDRSICPHCRHPLTQSDLNDIRGVAPAPQNAPATPVDPMDLIDAAQEGDAARVQELIAAGADVNHADPTGRTALLYASWLNHYAVARALLAVGANPNIADINNWTALMWASYGGYTAIVRALLGEEDVIAVDHASNDGATALTIAVEKGHDEVVAMLEAAQHAPADPTAHREWVDAAREGNLARVQEMLAAGTDVDDADPSGWTALMWASYGDHAAVVRALLAAEPSANVNAVSNNGWTALLIASQNGHTSIVRALLAAGADVGVARDGETALDVARYHGETEVVALLEAAQDAARELVEAARDGNLARVRELLDAGANVNQADNHGDTALMAASRYGHATVVEMLLAAGADVNHADNRGWTALMWASRSSHAAIVEMLLAAGADANQADAYGGTALLYASYNGHVAIVTLLLSAGADPNHTDVNSNRLTSLMDASYNGHVAIVTLLLSAGADPNHTDVNSGTALMEASARGHAAIVKALLDAGANVNQTNRDGDTALMLAQEQNHPEVVAMLEAAQNAPVDADEIVQAARDGNLERVRELLAVGVNVNHTNANDSTPLLWASRMGHTAIVEMLLAAEPPANVNQANEFGMTALIYASIDNHRAVVEALLDAGANVNRAANDGWTALMWASWADHPTAVEMLLAAGANVNHASNDGRTALMIAQTQNNPDVVAVLENAA
jgi:serine/threonine-protein phosphatase 6 regulatory ankyrin repeat subunit B